MAYTIKELLEILHPEMDAEGISDLMEGMSESLLNSDLSSSNYEEVKAAVDASLKELPAERSTEVCYFIHI
ncbi:MAG: hypothetical protein LBL58_09175 [Tannerellaceae bacterium]|jgi:hypothetical protein|nr:hypothetical protein [Tannerellaceae bacterium]